MKTIFLFLLVSFAESASAQTGGRFAVARSVVAGGGATLSGSGRFQWGYTIAQPLAAGSSGSRFSIQGGFWIGPAPIRPVIFAPAKSGGNFIFSFQTELGKTYAAQYVDSLTTSNWQSLTPISGDGTAKTVTNSASGAAQRFYRIIEK